MGRLIDEYEDIKTQQECVSKTIDTLWKMAQKYQQLQADYENRLKSDMVAMLEEIQLQIQKKQECANTGNWNSDLFSGGVDYGLDTSCDIIQEKIDKLRGENNGNK